MIPITLDHIRQAAEWAEKAGVRKRWIGGLERRYNQCIWDCGTSCCIWGAASILAGCGPASAGPPREWSAQSLTHALAASVMNSKSSTPEQMLKLFADEEDGVAHTDEC